MDIKEVIKAAEENVDLQKAIVSYSVTTEAGKEMIKNSNETHWKDNIGEEVRNMHGKYDADVESILGIKKPDGMKSYEHVKKLLGELKSLKEGGSDDKVKALELKLAEALKGNGDDTHEKLYKQTVEAMEKLKDEKNTEVSRLKDEMKVFVIESDLLKGESGLEFDPSFDKGVLAKLLKVERDELIRNASIEDGRVIYKDAEGKIIQGADMGMANSSEILKKALFPMLKKASSAGGGAADTGGGIAKKTGDDGKSTETLVLDKSRVTSKTSFMGEVDRVLKEQAVDVTSDRASKLRDAAAADYHYDALPRQ
jgi:hypothetical protein